MRIGGSAMVVGGIDALAKFRTRTFRQSAEIQNRSIWGIILLRIAWTRIALVRRISAVSEEIMEQASKQLREGAG